MAGRSSTTKSVPLQRSFSAKTPRSGAKVGFQACRCIRSNHAVFWLMLMAFWVYIVFYVQLKLAGGHDIEAAEFVGYKSVVGRPRPQEAEVRKPPNIVVAPEHRPLKKKKFHAESVIRGNGSYGSLVGPFSSIEDSVLGWNADKRRGTCERDGHFARAVWSRSFVLIFHELSSTQAPAAMMELATEILSCGGQVSAVVLDNRGELKAELGKRGVKVLRNSAEASFKAGWKADSVVAGSAASVPWIERYLDRFPSGWIRVVWWIMEEQREHFDRSRHLLGRVRMLSFLSAMQQQKWLVWCGEEGVHLKTQPTVVPLSVSDEVAFAAGIPSSLNTRQLNAERMLEKKSLLRAAVRKEMGLDESDFLVIALSTGGAAESGWRMLVESALRVVQHRISPESYRRDIRWRMMNMSGNSNGTLDERRSPNVVRKKVSETPRKKRRRSMRQRRLLAADSIGPKERSLKVLLGFGSKSNGNVEEILQLISEQANLSKHVLWSPTPAASTGAASLYAAADAFVVNTQGTGESFQRRTIEAMAFGLPVLGSNAEGIEEMVMDSVSGLLHPVGRQGVGVLADNIHCLMNNATLSHQMGQLGKELVQSKYLKQHTYSKLAQVFRSCMRMG